MIFSEPSFKSISKLQVYPDVYKWTAYPITCWLETIWRQFEQLRAEKKRIPPYVVETLAMLERTLNFSQTGNTKVLCKKMMDYFGLSLGLIQDGCPMLRSDIITFDENEETVSILHVKWPTKPKTTEPLVASMKSHTLNYGHSHFEVIRCFLRGCIATHVRVF
jgi:hypothetical protein